MILGTALSARDGKVMRLWTPDFEVKAEWSERGWICSMKLATGWDVIANCGESAEHALKVIWDAMESFQEES